MELLTSHLPEETPPGSINCRRISIVVFRRSLLPVSIRFQQIGVSDQKHALYEETHGQSLVFYSFVAEFRIRVVFIVRLLLLKSMLQMKQPLQNLNQSQRTALAGVFVLLFPILFPNLFRPLGRASPSLFSVSSLSLSVYDDLFVGTSITLLVSSISYN